MTPSMTPNQGRGESVFLGADHSPEDSLPSAAWPGLPNWFLDILFHFPAMTSPLLSTSWCRRFREGGQVAGVPLPLLGYIQEQPGRRGRSAHHQPSLKENFPCPLALLHKHNSCKITIRTHLKKESFILG